MTTPTTTRAHRDRRRVHRRPGRGVHPGSGGRLLRQPRSATSAAPVPASTCCGTAEAATAAGSCCDPAAKAEAVAAGAGCCG